MSQNNNDINYNSLKDIGKWFLIIFTILFVAQWCLVNNQLSTIKEQNRKKLDTLIKLNSNDELKFAKTKEGKYFIEAKELVKVDNKIKSLSKEIYSETHRAESIIDKDLDRLNLYMAIGIGFMTLLGIFVPILVNVISVQDLKEKQNSLKEKIEKLPSEEKLEEAIKNANEAVSKSSEIESLKLTAEKILPKVYTLSLQISINRFFNMNANYLQEFALKGNYARYTNLLRIIKEELTKCKDDDLHKIYEDESLKDTISDFSKILNDERFVFATYITIPEISNKFIELSSSLNKLASSSQEDQAENYDNVTLKIEELISLFNTNA
jgi:ribosomal 50S subunit-associated protein YjgA (DUF615 family)